MIVVTLAGLGILGYYAYTLSFFTTNNSIKTNILERKLPKEFIRKQIENCSERLTREEKLELISLLNDQYE